MDPHLFASLLRLHPGCVYYTAPFATNWGLPSSFLFAKVLSKPNMTPERNNLPSWAERERWTDLAWITSQLPLLHVAAEMAFQSLGRGAIVVDTTSRAAGERLPCAYFTAEAIQRYEDAHINRLVTQYDPQDELVIVLLKAESRTSSYRICSLPPAADLTTTRH